MSAYQFNIKYRATNQNGNADALSRIPLQNTEEICESIFWQEATNVNKVQVNSLPITEKNIAKAIEQDKRLPHVVYYTVYGWPQESCSPALTPYHRIKEELTLEEGCLL